MKQQICLGYYNCWETTTGTKAFIIITRVTLLLKL